METNTAKQKNNLIKQFLLLNILWLVLLFLLPPIFIIIFSITITFQEILSGIVLLWFIIKYLTNRRNKNINLEHKLLTDLKIKEFSLLETNAGIIISQFIFIITFLYTRNLSFPLDLVAILPLALLATVFESEYKKNNKIIKSRNNLKE